MTIEQLKRAYPRWRFFRSVTGHLVYGQRRRTSPPVTVWAADLEGLRGEIEAEMRYREQRWG